MTIMDVDATDGAVATETTHERILVRDAEAAAPPGMGWHRDLPDFRDYTSEHDAIAPLLAQTSAATEEKAAGETTHDDWRGTDPSNPDKR